MTKHLSPEYHAAHLAFARAGIVQAAADRKPILDMLLVYSNDVARAERDRIVGLIRAEAAQCAESGGADCPGARCFRRAASLVEDGQVDLRA
jgi:hypothetical protein